jgi:hypothetical protein
MNTKLQRIIKVTPCRYIDSLRAGRSGDRILVGARFSAPVQTGSEAHPASYIMDTGSFPGVKRAVRGVDHSPHLGPRLKRERSYTSNSPLGLRDLFYSELSLYIGVEVYYGTELTCVSAKWEMCHGISKGVPDCCQVGSFGNCSHTPDSNSKFNLCLYSESSNSNIELLLSACRIRSLYSISMLRCISVPFSSY